MMNYIWGGMMITAVVVGIVNGRIDMVSDAILSGGTTGVELCITMLGMMLLWGGLTAIMQQSGLSRGLSKLLAPLMGWLFPELEHHSKAKEAIAMNVAANMLGLGNAATPLGLKAMKELSRINGGGKVASNSMIMFVVLNSVSVQLLPTGLFILRKQYGSVSPTEILPAVWFASVLSALVGILLVKFCNGKKRNHYE